MSATPQDHQSATFTREVHGKSITLPSMNSVMTFGRARRLRKLPEEEQMFTIMEEICDEEQLAVLDEMDPTETEEFFTAWQEHSGITVGESLR